MADYTDYFTPIKNGYMQRLRYCLKDDFLLAAGEDASLLNERVSDNEANIKRGFGYYIVVKPSTFTPVQGQDMNSKEWQMLDWTMRVELYVRFQEAMDQGSLFDPFRSAVIWHTMYRRFLKAEVIESVSIAEVPHVDKIRSITPLGDFSYYRFLNVAPTMNPNFMFQALAVVVRQRVRFS